MHWGTKFSRGDWHLGACSVDLHLGVALLTRISQRLDSNSALACVLSVGPPNTHYQEATDIQRNKTGKTPRAVLPDQKILQQPAMHTLRVRSLPL